MKLLDVIKLNEGDVVDINDKRKRDQLKQNVDALGSAIQQAMTRPEDRLPLVAPQRKPGVWITTFIESTGERVSVEGPFKNVDQAKKFKLDQKLREEQELEVEDEDDRFDDEWLYDNYGPDSWSPPIELRVPKQFGKVLSIACVVDEEWIIITEGIIPQAEHLFLTRPTRAFRPPQEVIDIQHKIAQLRYDLYQLPPGASTAFIEKRIGELRRELDTHKIYDDN
jgi:hypothetical protein